MREEINKILWKYRTVKAGLKKTRKRLKEIKREVSDIEQAQEIIQQVAQEVQQQVHNKIAKVVSQCLEAVFDDPYEFKIKFNKTKRGNTEAKLSFIRGKEIDPKTGSGSGVMDIASFALRLASLMITDDSVRKILVLDEPFKFVSKSYKERTSELLLKLSKKLNVQFIIITHIPEFKMGLVKHLGEK